LNLLALEVRRIVIRLDACGQCPIGRVMPDIRKTIGVAQGILEARGEAARLSAVGAPERRQRTRPVIDARNPPVSRRDFFRTFVAKTTRQVQELLPPLPDVTPGQKAAPPERRRLISALRQLPAAKSETPLPDGLPFVRFAVSADCTACGVCARACPTGALHMRTLEDHFELTFVAGECTACGLCVKFCKDGALRHDGALSLAEVLNPQPVVLKTGPLKHCTKCGAPFAGQAESTLCPICEMRRKNPFGQLIQPAGGMNRATGPSPRRPGSASDI
jgi:formate hydrogenlyase subunit 6/NADH:ubiquinone oxidoreductase subunit I